MSISVKLYNYLLQNTEITALLADRIHTLSAPIYTQKPYSTFRIVSDSSEYTLNGDSGQGRIAFQISIIFEDCVQAANIVEVIRQEVVKWPASESEIQMITKTGYGELYEYETNLKHINLDFEVFTKI